MSGRKSQRRGRAYEREARDDLKALNVPDVKLQGIYDPHDLLIGNYIVECKRSKRSRGGLHKIFTETGADIVLHRGDNEPSYATVPMYLLAEFLRGKA